MTKKSGVKEKAKKPVRARTSKKAPPKPKKRAPKKVPAKNQDQKSLERLLYGVVDAKEHNLGNATFVKVMEGNECAVKFLGGPFHHFLSGVPAGTTVPVSILKNPMFVLRKCVKPEVYLAKAALYKYFRGYVPGNGQAPKSATAPRDIATLVAEAVKRREETSVAKPAEKESKPSEDQYQGSADINLFKSGNRGKYVLGKPGARVFIDISEKEKRNRNGTYTIVRAIQCEEGASLFGKCQNGVYIPFGWLKKESLDEVTILGSRASDMEWLHWYLLSFIRAHEKNQAQAARSSSAEKPGSFDPHKGNGKGNFLRIPESRMSQQAAPLLSPKPAGEGEPVH